MLGYGAGALATGAATYFIAALPPEVPRPFSNGIIYLEMLTLAMYGYRAHVDYDRYKRLPQVMPALKGLFLGATLGFSAMTICYKIEAKSAPLPPFTESNARAPQLSIEP